MRQVPQASMRSTASLVQSLRVSPCLSRYLLQPSSCWNSSFVGRGIYMVQSIEGGRAWEKNLGVSVLTSQTCSFYAGIIAGAISLHRR